MKQTKQNNTYRDIYILTSATNKIRAGYWGSGWGEVRAWSHRVVRKLHAGRLAPLAPSVRMPFCSHRECPRFPDTQRGLSMIARWCLRNSPLSSWAWDIRTSPRGAFCSFWVFAFTSSNCPPALPSSLSGRMTQLDSVSTTYGFFKEPGHFVTKWNVARTKQNHLRG